MPGVWRGPLEDQAPPTLPCAWAAAHVHVLALSQGPPRRSFFISILFGSSREVRRSTSIKTRHVGWLVLRRVKTAKVAICSGSFALQ